MFYNKKIIISSFFLFLVIFALTFPQITNASFWGTIVSGFGVILAGITKIFSDITASMLGWVISDAINLAYTPHPAGWGNNNIVVDAGWKICRDLANMLVVLGFVVIAIATILRFGEYEAKKLLPKLIIVAILVNFSPVICGLVIDASNITMNFFMKGSVQEILPNWETQYNTIWTAREDAGDALSASAGFIAGNTLGFFVFGLLFFLFLTRYVMLWILVIFSPIAFVCYVFPFTNQYFKQWWDQFLKWCIMGIPAAFTLYLANMSYSLNISRPAGEGEFMNDLFTFMLPAMIMLVGFFYSLKFSGAGAAIAVGAAAAVGGVALGAVKGLGKATRGVLSKVTGAGTAANWASQKFGRGLEAIGAKPIGSTALQGEGKRKDALARANAEYAERPDKVISRAGSRGGKREDREANAIVAAMEGKADLKNPQFLSNYRSAINRGHDVKEAEQKNPELTRHNERKASEIMARPSFKGNRADAGQLAVDETYQKLNVGKIRELPKESLNMDFVRNVSGKKIGKATQEMSQGGINQLKALLPTIAALRNATPRGTPLWNELNDKYNKINAA